MYPSLALLACLACVTAYPAVFLPYKDERGGTDGSSLLDCTPSTDGSIRCRPVRHRNHNRTPGPERLHVLEMMEEDLDGMTVLEIAEEVFPLSPKKQRKGVVVEEDLIDPSFVITVPELPESKTHKCGPHQIYVPEIDICEDMAEHRVPPKAPVVSHASPFIIMSVGRYEREKCPEGEMMVPEIGICMEI